MAPQQHLVAACAALATLTFVVGLRMLAVRVAEMRARLNDMNVRLGQQDAKIERQDAKIEAQSLEIDAMRRENEAKDWSLRLWGHWYKGLDEDWDEHRTKAAPPPPPENG